MYAYTDLLEANMSEAVIELPEQNQVHASMPQLVLTAVSLWWKVNEQGNPDFVVNDLNASVDIARQPIWLKGRSGGGKSTLLRALAGHTRLWKPYPRSLNFTGSIVLGSEEVHACAERGSVGYAPQHHLFVEHISVKDNVCLPFTGRIGRNRSPEDDIPDLAAKLRLEDKLLRPVHSLSGGERDRVGFMRAYLLAQNVLVLDEPFGSSDGEVRRAMFALCREWLKDGHSRLLVFTSHDPGDAEELDARVLHLQSPTEGEVSTWRLE